MRMQFVPLPAMNPLQPSSLHIFARAFGTDILYSSRPTLWTWNKILRRSRGETTVRETAPATPPAMKEATTGCARVSLNFWNAVGSGAPRGCNCLVSWSLAAAQNDCNVRLRPSLAELAQQPLLRYYKSPGASVITPRSKVSGAETKGRNSSSCTFTECRGRR